MCDGIEPSHSLAANTVDFSTMSCTYSAGSPNIVCAVPLAYCFQTAMPTIQFSNKQDSFSSYCVIVVSPIPVIIGRGLWTSTRNSGSIMHRMYRLLDCLRSHKRESNPCYLLPLIMFTTFLTPLVLNNLPHMPNFLQVFLL